MKRVRKQARKRPSMADRADPHVLYQKSVQSPDFDIPFFAEYFENYTGRPLRSLREDFCGTAALSTYFVTQHTENHAVGIDLDWPTLNWGIKHNVSPLTVDQQNRLTLIQGNVLDASSVTRAIGNGVELQLHGLQGSSHAPAIFQKSESIAPARRHVYPGHLGRQRKPGLTGRAP